MNGCELLWSNTTSDPAKDALLKNLGSSKSNADIDPFNPGTVTGCVSDTFAGG